MQIVTALGLLILTCAGASGASPQRSSQGSLQSDLERLQGLAISRIPEFRRQVRAFLDDREKRIEASIDYSVLATGAVNAQAIQAGGKRKILVGAGVLQVFEWLSVGNMMSRWSSRDCGVEYQKHVISGVVANGNAPEVARVYEPFTFARRHPEICRGVSYSAFENDTAAKELQPAVLGASFRHILAHELAHQIFNHHAQTDEESRRNEEEADAFAFRVSSADPSSIILALPAYQVLAGLGADIEDEAKSSHPAGARRMQTFAGALKALPVDEPEFRRYLDENGLRTRWNQAVDQLIQEIAKALGN